MAPTSGRHRPCPRFLHSFTGAHPPVDRRRISLVTTSSQCQARHGLGPRGVPNPLAIAQLGLLPAGGTNPSALSNGNFGALHLQGRLHPLPLHLACFRAYASARLLPDTQQGSILGPWLAVTQVGFPPTKVRGIAKPHRPLSIRNARSSPLPLPSCGPSLPSGQPIGYRAPRVTASGVERRNLSRTDPVVPAPLARESTVPAPFSHSGCRWIFR